METCEAAVIGAGPYGLAAAAHLRAANVEVYVLGELMAFWRRNMPMGMLLRSPWRGSNIADPHRALTLDRCVADGCIQRKLPIPLNDFITYGEWFQRRAVPDVDTRHVTRVERSSGGFRLALEDDAVLQARRVIVATGLVSHPRRPPAFNGLPASLASHSSEHADFARFACKSVVVVGAGQSALESAVLLHEAGAEVEVIVRAPQLYWLGAQSGTVGVTQQAVRQLPSPIRQALRSVRQHLGPPTEVGPFPQSWLIELPDILKVLPYELQERLATRAIRPAGAGWLRPRICGVRITLGRAVVSAEPTGAQLHLALDDGTERTVDHALLATGYHVNVANYPFLGPEIVRDVSCVDGYPLLSFRFESSVPGLHFIGAAAARTFGPVMRFVGGTMYAGRALTRHVGGRPSPIAA